MTETPSKIDTTPYAARYKSIRIQSDTYREIKLLAIDLNIPIGYCMTALMKCRDIKALKVWAEEFNAERNAVIRKNDSDRAKEAKERLEEKKALKELEDMGL